MGTGHETTRGGGDKQCATLLCRSCCDLHMGENALWQRESRLRGSVLFQSGDVPVDLGTMETEIRTVLGTPLLFLSLLEQVV